MSEAPERVCGACQHKFAEPNDLTQVMCRRYPPQVVVVPTGGPMGPGLAIQGRYPPVHLKMPACGEYKPKLEMMQ